MELWLSALSLLCEVIVVWLCAHPFLCRGDCYFGFMPCLLCRDGCVKRGVVYSKFVSVKSSVEDPCVGGPVWTYSGNPSV